MYSQRKFTPGNNSNASRVINYIAEYNARNPNSVQKCICYGNTYNKNVIESDSPSQRQSNNQRIAYLCRTRLGGSTQYGNNYLGELLNLNYLGKMAGMPGGSGRPPSNKF
jgi:hypothetical protein